MEHIMTAIASNMVNQIVAAAASIQTDSNGKAPGNVDTAALMEAMNGLIATQRANSERTTSTPDTGNFQRDVTKAAGAQ